MTGNKHSPFFPKQHTYAGRILTGPYSSELQQTLTQTILHLEALEGMGSPIIPYIAAWRVDGEHIWYEYAGPRLHAMLGLKLSELASAFRANILSRCLYRTQKNPPSIDKIIRHRPQLDRLRSSMRRLAERLGTVEAVYKIDVNGTPIWLKDMARVERYESDGIVLSCGSLIDVSKEMQLEERLVEIQGELSRHRENLEGIVIERTRELRTAQLDVVNRLALAAACRDSHTGGHIKRLSKYCAILGRSYGLSKEATRVLFHAVPMHDVGKLAIDDAILRKQGPLTSQEFETIKTHCRVGADLLGGSGSALLQVASAIALTHHERWDGSGYPQGLAKVTIPLASRITTICDVFDALTSERPYKPAWTFEHAVQEVALLRNRHFDPQLVDLFLGKLPEIKRVYEMRV